MNEILDRIQAKQALWALPDDWYITTDELALLLDCSTSHLCHWRTADKKGGPTYRKRGKLVRYKTADVREWFSQWEEIKRD